MQFRVQYVPFKIARNVDETLDTSVTHRKHHHDCQQISHCVPGEKGENSVIHFKMISFIHLYVFSMCFAESPLWLLLQVAPIRNERDLVVLLLLTFRDITAFKQLMDAEDTKSGEHFSEIPKLNSKMRAENSC